VKYLTPQIIAEVTGGEYVGDEYSRSVRVVGAVRDNREVMPGNLFVCIRGARADGHSFANKAFESGAACCLAEHTIKDAKGPYVLVESTLEAIRTLGEYYRSLFHIPVIGITGSVGKTTTKELIAAVLGAKLCTLKTPKNMNNELGVPLTLLSLEERHEAAVIEMGISSFGEMSRLAKMVQPEIFVMTRIGYSHLEELGDLDGVLRAKSEALAFMKPDGVVILNGDDDLLREYNTDMRRITFGLEKQNDFRAQNVSAKGVDSVTCDIVSDSGRYSVEIPAYGSHIASLASAAAAIGRLLGLSDEEVIRGFLEYVPVDGRVNVISTGTITLIDDCYNANPNSVKAAITSLSTLSGRRVAILGDMLDLGKQSAQFHAGIGSFAAHSGIEILICCGAMAKFIYDGYKSAGGTMAHFYPEKAELIEALSRLLEDGDSVLIKASHGMHFEELLPYLKQISLK